MSGGLRVEARGPPATGRRCDGPPTSGTEGARLPGPARHAHRRTRRGATLARVIESLVEQIEARFGELSQAMTDPEVIGDRRRYAEAGREYWRLEPAARLAEQWRRAT